jgi:hypothetical protein
MTYEKITLQPEPEFTHEGLARTLLELGWAQTLEEGQVLARFIEPDLPTKTIQLEDHGL